MSGPGDSGGTEQGRANGDHDHGHGTPGGGGHRSSVGPRASRIILVTFWTLAGVVAALDFVIHRHTEHPAEELPVFYALYGFIGVAGLILASTWLRRLVMRSEDYYDAE